MAKSKIIKDFVSARVDISIVLKQLKILLLDFDKKELLDWVNNELQGYGDDVDMLPEYRKLSGSLVGSYLNFNLQANNMPIGLRNDAPKEMRDACSVVRITQSIEALKRMQPEGKYISSQIPGDLLPFIQRYVNVSMTFLSSASIKTSDTGIIDIISTVENKALDILILLEREFGCLDELDIDLGTKEKENIEKIAGNIYYIMYDNSITIGDRNTIKDSEILSNCVETE